MIITEQKDLEQLCDVLHKHPYLTVDTEFLRERTYYPRLCLIQIGTPGGNAAAIDPIAGDLDLAPLLDLVFDPAVVKVFHAARQDLEIFYNLSGRVVEPLFDTQIAAMVCGYGESIGYENLVRSVTGATLDKGVQFTDWSKRPLSQRQIDYALGDVIHLSQIYRCLSAELAERDRTDWVHEEERALRDPEQYAMPPERAWERIKLRSPKPKTLAVLRDLAAWRETRAREKDLPRSWILKDDTVADLASQAPQTIDQLAKIRGVSRDMAEGRTGATLLEVIAAALNSDSAAWPKREEKRGAPPDSQSIVEILKMLLRIKAAQHDVAARLIATTDDLDAIAESDTADVPALKGWRLEVFGRDALALKRGEISIGLKNGKIAAHAIGEMKK